MQSQWVTDSRWWSAFSQLGEADRSKEAKEVDKKTLLWTGSAENSLRFSHITKADLKKSVFVSVYTIVISFSGL